MSKFRKKPVVIEAWTVRELTDMLASDWPDAFREEVERGNIQVVPRFSTRAGPRVHIRTLEGEMLGGIDDYIIRGVKGEFYPCKPDIFAATYEPADAAPVPAREWIPVGERLPGGHERVAFWSTTWPVATYPGYGFALDSRWFDVQNADHGGEPAECPRITHWFALPPPPAADK